MMYKNKLVASVKCAGQILREKGEEVYLPFGAQYSILLKNLNSVPAKITVYIDGENVFGNYSLVLGPGETSEVERFVRNGNLEEGNKFKFIEKTGAIEAYRGNKLEDGLVRVEYQFEKVVEKPQDLHIHHHHHHPIYGPYTPRIWGGPYYDNNIWCATAQGAGESYSGQMNVNKASLNNVTRGVSSSTIGASVNNMSGATTTAGITVPGEQSSQKFDLDKVKRVYEDKMEVIIFKLIGQVENKVVLTPVTVKTNQICTTCGKKNKANAKFCSECGTNLTII